MSEDRGEIVDLGEREGLHARRQQKEYTVETFDEIRKRMREEAEKARKEMEKQEPRKRASRKAQSRRRNTRSTSTSRTRPEEAVIGYDTHETVMTVHGPREGQDARRERRHRHDDDMWMAPAIPSSRSSASSTALLEGASGRQRRPSMSPSSSRSIMAAYPLFGKAMERMQKDRDKLNGTAIDTTTTLETVKGKDDTTQTQSSGGGGLGGHARAQDDEEGVEAAFDDLHDAHPVPRRSRSRSPRATCGTGGLQVKK
jgi:hypothetical protein